MNQEFRIEIPQFDPRWSRSLVPLVAIVIACLALLSSSVYSVGAESVGVIQRFGKYTGTVDPGLRFKLPFGIDRVTILPVKRQLKMEFGFGTGGATTFIRFHVSRNVKLTW